MAWESRASKGSYFTLTVRGPRRRRRVYCGRAGSAEAELAASLLEIGQLERQRQRAVLAEEIQCWRSLEADLKDYWAGVDQLVRASLLAANYYRHCRSWRKRGGQGRDRAG